MPGLRDLLTNPTLPDISFDEPALQRSPFEASLRGLASGVYQGVRGMSSPVDLALMGTPLRALRGLKPLAPAVKALERIPSVKMNRYKNPLGPATAETEGLYDYLMTRRGIG